MCELLPHVRVALFLIHQVKAEMAPWEEQCAAKGEENTLVEKEVPLAARCIPLKCSCY